MPVQKIYLAEPHVLEGLATLTALIGGDSPRVQLDRTYFHPQGGGQKGDRGVIGPVAALDTRHAGEGEVDHHVSTLDGLRVGETYRIAVDVPSRRLNMVLHSAGHLIAAVVNPAFPEISAVQGHHWPGEARVEFAGNVTDDVGARVAAFVQPALDKALAERWPVALKGDPFVNRSVQFGDSEGVPCGGTHVAHLGQIARVVVKSVKKKGDRLRITYDADVNETAF